MSLPTVRYILVVGAARNPGYLLVYTFDTWDPHPTFDVQYLVYGYSDLSSNFNVQHTSSPSFL